MTKKETDVDITYVTELDTYVLSSYDVKISAGDKELKYVTDISWAIDESGYVAGYFKVLAGAHRDIGIGTGFDVLFLYAATEFGAQYVLRAFKNVRIVSERCHIDAEADEDQGGIQIQYTFQGEAIDSTAT